MKKFVFAFFAVAVCCAMGVVMMAAKQTNIKKLSSTMTTRTVTVKDFSELDVSRVDVIFTPGPATGKVVVTAPENIAQYIKVYVKGSTLKIELDNEVQFNNGSINAVAKVSAPWLKEIEASLSAKVNLASEMTVPDDLELETSTSAQIIAPAITVTGNCDIDATTSGCVTVKSLKVNGKTDLESSTSGVIRLDALTAATADFEANTSGVIKVDKGSSSTAKFEASTSGVVKAPDFVASSEATAEASTSGSITANYKSLRKCTTSTGGTIKRTGI